MASVNYAERSSEELPSRGSRLYNTSLMQFSIQFSEYIPCPVTAAVRYCIGKLKDTLTLATRGITVFDSQSIYRLHSQQFCNMYVSLSIRIQPVSFLSGFGDYLMEVAVT